MTLPGGMTSSVLHTQKSTCCPCSSHSVGTHMSDTTTHTKPVNTLGLQVYSLHNSSQFIYMYV